MSLAKLDAIKTLLSTAESVEDVKDIRDTAEALRLYAKQAGYGLDVQNRVAELKLRAESQLLSELVRPGNPQLSQDAKIGRRLSDLGVEKDQSSRWHLEATVPEDEFERFLIDLRDRGKEITSVELLRLAGRLRAPDEISVQPPKGKYRCLVVDPPWPIEKIQREERPLQTRALDYPSWTIDRIKAFDISKWAFEDGCHVYLWRPHRYYDAASEIFKAWQVNYECELTWHKNVGLTPFSWMHDTEHVLFGRIGTLELLKKGERLLFEGKVREHSRKPAEFYELVRRVSPEPRLDMFSREPHEGFEQWGNEPDLFVESANGGLSPAPPLD
jgi:N6-adenosine-specific RNA methylase IME4